jgi:hypothetical protein
LLVKQCERVSYLITTSYFRTTRVPVFNKLKASGPRVAGLIYVRLHGGIKAREDAVVYALSPFI